MKKILLLLFAFNYSFAQTPDVEIRLVNASVGTPILISVSDPFNPSGFNYTTNDAGLNAIFSTYGVYFIPKNNHIYPPYQDRILSAIGTYPSGLITDLLNYSTVVQSATVSDLYSFSDALRLTLVNPSIGIPTGSISGIITTNDSGLNTIFQDFNVFYYTLYNSNTYNVVCNCDKNLLKSALNSYNTVISYSLETGTSAAILSNNSFNDNKTIISPNPFTNSFEIETDDIITNYYLFDITGKELIVSNSKIEIDNTTLNLNKGIYLLTLEFENGIKSNYKLIKN